MKQFNGMYVYIVNLQDTKFNSHLPYSGLFPWGANFRYFCGSPGCHEIFLPTKFTAHCSAVCTCSNLYQQCFVMALFCYLCPIDSALDTQGPLFQAVLCVMADEVNRAV